MDWPESELSPVLFDALTCELAILVDGAAIGNIAVRNYVCGSSYALNIFLRPTQPPPACRTSRPVTWLASRFSIWSSPPAST